MKRSIRSSAKPPYLHISQYDIPQHGYLRWMFGDELGGAGLTNRFNLKYDKNLDKEDTQIEFLVSRGFDNASKINELIKAWRSDVDILPLVENGFKGSAADLKRLVQQERLNNYYQHKDEIIEKYNEYWDESQNAYVFDVPDSKNLANNLVDDLNSLSWFKYGSKKPTYVKKYVTPGKYYVVYIHEDWT